MLVLDGKPMLLLDLAIQMPSWAVLIGSRIRNPNRSSGIRSDHTPNSYFLRNPRDRQAANSTAQPETLRHTFAEFNPNLKEGAARSHYERPPSINHARSGTHGRRFGHGVYLAEDQHRQLLSKLLPHGQLSCTVLTALFGDCGT